MQSGTFSKKKVWIFWGVVLLVLTADYLISISATYYFPLGNEKDAFQVLIGIGMSMIVLISLIMYFFVFRENHRLEISTEKNRQVATNYGVQNPGPDENAPYELSLRGPNLRLEERILLSTVIEQTEDNVLISDNHRTILYINPAFERSSGYSCDELKGKPMRWLRSDQHDKTFFQRMKDILDHGETWMGVIVNKGKDGVDLS